MARVCRPPVLRRTGKGARGGALSVSTPRTLRRSPHHLLSENDCLSRQAQLSSERLLGSADARHASCPTSVPRAPKPAVVRVGAKENAGSEVYPGGHPTLSQARGGPMGLPFPAPPRL